MSQQAWNPVIAALVATTAIAFQVASSLVCDFITVEAKSGELLAITEESEDMALRSTSIGLNCQGDFYNLDDDKMWRIANGFAMGSLAFGVATFLISWTIVIISPTVFLWKSISVAASTSALLQVPAFVLFDTYPCSDFEEQQECKLASGCYFLICSVLAWVGLTAVTQFLDPPMWREKLHMWRLPKCGIDRHIPEEEQENDRSQDPIFAKGFARSDAVLPVPESIRRKPAILGRVREWVDHSPGRMSKHDRVVQNFSTVPQEVVEAANHMGRHMPAPSAEDEQEQRDRYEPLGYQTSEREDAVSARESVLDGPTGDESLLDGSNSDSLPAKPLLNEQEVRQAALNGDAIYESLLREDVEKEKNAKNQSVTYTDDTAPLTPKTPSRGMFSMPKRGSKKYKMLENDHSASPVRQTPPMVEVHIANDHPTHKTDGISEKELLSDWNNLFDESNVAPSTVSDDASDYKGELELNHQEYPSGSDEGYATEPYFASSEYEDQGETSPTDGFLTSDQDDDRLSLASEDDEQFAANQNADRDGFLSPSKQRQQTTESLICEDTDEYGFITPEKSPEVLVAKTEPLDEQDYDYHDDPDPLEEDPENMSEEDSDEEVNKHAKRKFLRPKRERRRHINEGSVCSSTSLLSFTIEEETEEDLKNDQSDDQRLEGGSFSENTGKDTSVGNEEDVHHQPSIRRAKSSPRLFGYGSRPSNAGVAEDIGKMTGVNGYHAVEVYGDHGEAQSALSGLSGMDSEMTGPIPADQYRARIGRVLDDDSNLESILTGPLPVIKRRPRSKSEDSPPRAHVKSTSIFKSEREMRTGIHQQPSFVSTSSSSDEDCVRASEPDARQARIRRLSEVKNRAYHSRSYFSTEMKLTYSPIRPISPERSSEDNSYSSAPDIDAAGAFILDKMDASLAKLARDTDDEYGSEENSI